MLKIKDDELELYSKNKLIEIIKQIEEDNKTKDNIIRELNYRLEKLNIKPEIKIYDYEHPTLGEIHCTRHIIPEFVYYEYQNFDRKGR